MVKTTKKLIFKHKPVSVSLPDYQVGFIKTNKHFNFSKFVQICMDEYMGSFDEFKELIQKYNLNLKSKDEIVKGALENGEETSD